MQKDGSLILEDATGYERKSENVQINLPDRQGQYSGAVNVAGRRARLSRPVESFWTKRSQRIPRPVLDCSTVVYYIASLARACVRDKRGYR